MDVNLIICTILILTKGLSLSTIYKLFLIVLYNIKKRNINTCFELARLRLKDLIKRTIQASKGIRQVPYMNELNLQLPGCDKSTR